jgi:hypothetical protein
MSDWLGFKRRKLLKVGTQGEAVVLETEQTYHHGEHGGWTDVAIRMKFRFPDGEVREYRRSATAGDVPYLEGGSMLPVRYDPSDRELLEIDIPEIARRSAAASAANREAGIAEAEARLAGTPTTDVPDAAASLLDSLGSLGSEVHVVSGDPAQTSATVAELLQLAQLHRSGSLTDAEFDAAKRRLLG